MEAIQNEGIVDTKYPFLTLIEDNGDGYVGQDVLEKLTGVDSLEAESLFRPIMKEVYKYFSDDAKFELKPQHRKKINEFVENAFWEILKSKMGLSKSMNAQMEHRSFDEFLREVTGQNRRDRNRIMIGRGRDPQSIIGRLKSLEGSNSPDKPKAPKYPKESQFESNFESVEAPQTPKLQKVDPLPPIAPKPNSSSVPPSQLSSQQKPKAPEEAEASYEEDDFVPEPEEPEVAPQQEPIADFPRLSSKLKVTVEGMNNFGFSLRRGTNLYAVVDRFGNEVGRFRDREDAVKLMRETGLDFELTPQEIETLQVLKSRSDPLADLDANVVPGGRSGILRIMNSLASAGMTESFIWKDRNGVVVPLKDLSSLGIVFAYSKELEDAIGGSSEGLALLNAVKSGKDAAFALRDWLLEHGHEREAYLLDLEYLRERRLDIRLDRVAREVMEMYGEDNEMDEAFDAGEFSGPAASRRIDQEIDWLAANNGLTYKEVIDRIQEIINADEGPHGRNE